MGLKAASCAMIFVVLIACPAARGQAYFPPGVFETKADPTHFTEKWYSGELECMKEPSLWEWSKTQKSEVYRFLYLRTFHPQISIRLNANSDGTGTVTIKECSLPRDGDAHPGKLLMSKTRALSKDETAYFRNEIDELGFWNMPTLEKADSIGVDGAQWILEGAKDGKYLVVDRWSPKDGPVHSIGISMLIDLARFKLLYQDVY